MSNRRKYTSIKPGRGPSFMGGIGSVIMIIFGIFWTTMAFQITRESPLGGPVQIFPVFGILFILMGVANAVYSFRNATQKDRYSILDITDSESEVDPLNELYGRSGEEVVVSDVRENHGARESDADESRAGQGGAGGAGSIYTSGVGAAEEQSARRYCPYCGRGVAADFRFCPSCGRELSE